MRGSYYNEIDPFAAEMLYEPLWVLGAAFCVFGAWLADRMYEAGEPA